MTERRVAHKRSSGRGPLTGRVPGECGAVHSISRELNGIGRICFARRAQVGEPETTVTGMRV